MKISALSKASGVSLATIKFYLRENLLPPGRALGARDAEYGDEHLERLDTIRGLRDVAGVPISRIRALMAAVDDPALPAFRLMGMAQAAVLPALADAAPDPAPAAALYGELGWEIPSASPVFSMTAGLLALLDKERVGTDAATLAPWIEAARIAARADTTALRPDASRAKLVRDVAVGTFLGNQLMLALRMAAQIDNVARKMAGASAEPA